MFTMDILYNGRLKMYNIGGLEWTPKIEVVIKYAKKYCL